MKLTLVQGQRASPRNDLWSYARAGATFNSLSDNKRYALALVSVTEGCGSKSRSITGLVPGERYYVRLSLNSPGREKTAKLKVFSDVHRTRLLGTQTLVVSGEIYRQLYLFVADSDKRYTIVQGRVGNYRLTFGDSKTATNLLSEPGLGFYQDRSNGGASPVFHIRGNELFLNADSKILRGYVNKPYVPPQSIPIQV